MPAKDKPLRYLLKKIFQNHWSRPHKSTGGPPTFIYTLDDVLGLKTDVVEVVTNSCVESLCIRLDKSVVDSFIVRLRERAVRVNPAVSLELRDDQIMVEALTARNQVVFEGHLACGRAAYQPTRVFPYIRIALLRRSKHIPEVLVLRFQAN